MTVLHDERLPSCATAVSMQVRFLCVGRGAGAAQAWAAQ